MGIDVSSLCDKCHTQGIKVKQPYLKKLALLMFVLSVITFLGSAIFDSTQGLLISLILFVVAVVIGRRYRNITDFYCPTCRSHYNNNIVLTTGKQGHTWKEEEEYITVKAVKGKDGRTYYFENIPFDGHGTRRISKEEFDNIIDFYSKDGRNIMRDQYGNIIFMQY